MARRESSLSFQKDHSTLITGRKRGVGLAFVILVRSEMGDTEIKRDAYNVAAKGFHFSCCSSLWTLFLLFVLGFWFCFSSSGLVPELTLTLAQHTAQEEKGQELRVLFSVYPTTKW